MHLFRLEHVAAVFGLAFGLVAQAASESGPSGHAEVELDGAGRLQKVIWGRDLQGESEAIKRAMEARLRGLKWEVTAEAPTDRVSTSVWVSTTFEPRGDKAVLQLIARYAGITYRKIEPPRYPISAVRNADQADVLVKVTIDAEGRPTDMTFQIAADEPEPFEESVRSAISQWRFNPERVNGAAIAGEVWVPILYSLGCRRSEQDFAFTPQPLPGLVHVEGEATMADMIEITGWRTSGARRTARECESDGS